VKKAVDDNGRMLCHRERRLNCAAQQDIMGVIESWLLTVDTYGSEAIEQVRDHLRYGLAYFVDSNPKQAIPKLLKVVDRAEALGARITYAYSIEKYMKVLQLQRPSIASQLESAYGTAPVNLEEDLMIFSINIGQDTSINGQFWRPSAIFRGEVVSPKAMARDLPAFCLAIGGIWGEGFGGIWTLPSLSPPHFSKAIFLHILCPRTTSRACAH
jgi:hypothetical protein